MKFFAVKWVLLFCATILFAWFTACGDIDIDSDTTDAMGGPSGAGEGTGDAGDLTWSNFAEAFVQDYCVRCHSDPPSQSAPYPLETYEQVSAKAALCAAEVDSGGMPPSDPLPSEEEIANFVNWASGGAPE